MDEAPKLPLRSCECGTMFRAKEADQRKCQRCLGKPSTYRPRKNYDNESIITRMGGAVPKATQKRIIRREGI